MSLRGACRCAAVALLAFITLVVLLVQRGGGVFVLIPFYLLLFLGGALLIRAVYFSLLARGDIEGAVVSAGSVLLIELPTFLWFTSLTLVILFWAMTSNSLHAKQLLRRVWLLFLATNAAMYIVLLSVLVAFAVTRDRVTLACQGRQPARIDQSRKRAMLLTYQVLLAVMGVGIGGVYVWPLCLWHTTCSVCAGIYQHTPVTTRAPERQGSGRVGKAAPTGTGRARGVCSGAATQHDVDRSVCVRLLRAARHLPPHTRFGAAWDP